MKTDSIFFEIFQTQPGILFELLGESTDLGKNYEFKSVEVKQTAFRIDGVFIPKPDAPEQTVIFVEVQFQKDEYLYDRLFAEIGMYLAQNHCTADWKAIAIFPRKSLEPKDCHRHRSLLQGEQVQVLYLQDFLSQTSDRIGIQIMQLIVATPAKAKPYVQTLVNQLQGRTDAQNQAIIDLVVTVMVYKFPTLSRKEIETMFTVSELKQTRVYQEAKAEGIAEGKAEGIAEGKAEGIAEGKAEGIAEGKAEGIAEGKAEGKIQEAQSLILRQLSRRLGAVTEGRSSTIAPDQSATLAPDIVNTIQALSLTQLENLGEALLGFEQLSDLDDWLRQNG